MANRGLLACALVGGSLFYAWRAVDRYAKQKLQKKTAERHQIQDWENEGGALRTTPQQPIHQNP